MQLLQTIESPEDGPQTFTFPDRLVVKSVKVVAVKKPGTVGDLELDVEKIEACRRGIKLYTFLTCTKSVSLCNDQ